MRNVNVTTSATAKKEAVPKAGGEGRFVSLRNEDATAANGIRVGTKEDVSATVGLLIPGGGVASFPLGPNEELWCQATAGTPALSGVITEGGGS